MNTIQTNNKILDFKSIILKPFILKNKERFDKAMLDLNIEQALSNQLYMLFVKSGIIKDLDLILDKTSYLYHKISAENPEESLFECDEELNNFILNEYQVLHRWISETITNHSTNFLELIKRLKSDEEKIFNTFGFKIVLNEIESIAFGVSDKHRGGKTVGIITTTSGFKLVYKPRNLSIDKNFIYLLNEITPKIGVPIRMPKFINYENYGWVEFIANSEVTTKDEIDNYYKKLGVELALLYVLEATDFHYENIIACGENPILIDLESFFHPYFPILGAEANQSIDQSVLRTGILPDLFSANFDIDKSISGISSVEGQEGILDRQQIILSQNNEIELTRQKGVMSGGINLPILNGDKISLTEEYVPFLIEGFKLMYSFVLSNKDQFINLLEVFKDDEVRVLFRDTVSYAHLLDEATHPSVLKNKDTLNDHLNYLTIAEEYSELIKTIVPHEKKSLENRDIPLFTSRVNSKNLWYSEDCYIENFFEKTGYETVVDKIKTLNEFDLNRQINIIQSVLLYKVDFKKSHNTESLLNVHSLEESCKVECSKIYDYLKRNIFSDNSYADWLIKDYDKSNKNNFIFSDPIYDLYSGMPGEILFLFFYHKIFRNEESKVLANKAYSRLSEKIEKAKDDIYPLGLYTGWGSIILLNSILGKEFKNETKFFNKIEEYLNQIDFKEIISRDKNFSLFKGAAGFIVACLHYFEQTKSEKALELANFAAEMLLSNAIENEEKISWKTISKESLTGLAHGSSGFTLAFAKLYNVTKNDKYKEVVFKSLNFEGSFYSKEFSNWKDRRDSFLNKEIHSSNWAHGSGGISMTRLELIKLGFEDNQIKSDLENGIINIKTSGFSGRNTLISGDLGNLDLLISYRDLFGDSEISINIENLLKTKLKQMHEKGWENGIGDKSNYTLGLMNGVTGIGYTLLRYLSSNQIPSLLI